MFERIGTLRRSLYPSVRCGLLKKMIMWVSSLYYLQILVVCAESKALNMYHIVANPLVSGNFFPLTEIRDWDMYRNREGLCYPNEFRMMEQFCRDCLPGVRRLADQQKARAAAAQYRQRSNPNPNHGQRDFHRDRGHGRTSEHDKKRELYLTVQPQTWRMMVSRSAPQGEGRPLPN